MDALSRLFDSTVLFVALREAAAGEGEIPLTGRELRVKALPGPRGTGVLRKLAFPFWLLRSLPCLLGAIRRADAVHTPVPGDMGTIGMLLARLLRKPLYVRHCGDWMHPRSVMERILRRTLEWIAGGERIVLATGGALNPPSTRNPEIAWIFSTTVSKSDVENIAVNRQAPSPASCRLAIAGRLDESKGVDIAIRAVRELRGELPGISLDVMGGGSIIRDLKKLAETLGIGSVVRFHGRVTRERLMDILRKSDIFVFPTATEGFPKVVIEAMSCGLPVITTPVSVLPILVDGAGLLIGERTPRAVADAVKELLSNPDRYLSFTAAAMRTASRYTVEAWREALDTHFTKSWAARGYHAPA